MDRPDATTHPALAERPARSRSVAAVIALTLLIAGGMNWALVELVGIDLIGALFGRRAWPGQINFNLERNFPHEIRRSHQDPQ